MTKQSEQRQQIPNMQILDSADQFYDAWDLLKKQPPLSGLLLPLINVGAIAIELYLKSLSADIVHTPDTTPVGLYLKSLLSTEIVHPDITFGDGWTVVTAKSQKSHTLTELFNLIDPDIWEKIELAFSNKEPTPKRTFLDTLKALEDAFSESRYSYEPGYDISKYDLGDFRLVVQCLHDFVHGLAKL